MTAAPRLTTARLVLRGPERDDLVPFTNMVTQSARMETVGGNGTADEAWRGFLGGVGHWQWHGYGFFTLVEKSSGTLAGRVGILNHLNWPEPELAWHVFDGFEGKGYAFEAAAAVRAWAGGTLGMSPLISLIAPGNARSLALATRLGASEERRIEMDGEEVIMMRHLAHDDIRAVDQWHEAAA
jgi:RimJ/RimL family protein N-acetyltransferase